MNACYAIASGKGGVGKSTLTAALGVCLAQAGKRVVLVDADIGLRSQDALLGLENQVVYDLIDLVKGDCLLEQALLSAEAAPGLKLLPASQFARAKALEPKSFRKVLGALRASSDVVLIDCPAGIERGLRNVLGAGVEEVLLVVTPDDVALRSAERACQVIAGKNLPRPRLLVNRLQAELIQCGEMMSAATAAQVLDLPLLGEIPEDQAVYRAQLRHDQFLRYDCEARRALLRIASRLQGVDTPFPAYGSRKPSWLQRLFRSEPREVIPLDRH